MSKVYLIYYQKCVTGVFKDYSSAESAILRYIGSDPHSKQGNSFKAKHGKTNYTLRIEEIEMGNLNLTYNKSSL